MVFRQGFYSPTHSLTTSLHTYSLTHSLSHSLTHSLTPLHTHTHSLTHSLTHTLTHSLTHTHSHTHSHTTHTLTHSLTHTHSHTHSHTPFTHTLTHSHPHTHSPTHSHSLTHSLTHSQVKQAAELEQAQRVTTEKKVDVHEELLRKAVVKEVRKLKIIPCACLWNVRVIVAIIVYICSTSGFVYVSTMIVSSRTTALKIFSNKLLGCCLSFACD